MSIYDNVAAGLKLNGYNNRHVLDEIVERSLKNSASRTGRAISPRVSRCRASRP